MNQSIFPYNFRILPVSATNREEIRATLPENASDAYTFQIEASNVNLDAYFTHMTKKTLQNFARDGKSGVAFLDSHNSQTTGYGRSFGGQVKTDSERQPLFAIPDGVELAVTAPSQYTYALLDIFTVPGIRFGGMLTYASTDDFIRAVDTGLVGDVSVGFYGGTWVCDVCGKDYRNYAACQHFGGGIYPIGEGGSRKVLATVSVDGANLAEVSAVYDGATPNASVLKARAMAEEGELDRETKRTLEVRYQVDLPTGRLFPGTKLNNGRQANGGSMELEKIVENIRATLAKTAAPPTAELPEQVNWLVAEVGRLQPLADAGNQYRADLIAAALAEGVRAMGEGFGAEAYRGILEKSDISVIKRMRDDWKVLGDKRFPGGPQVNEEADKKTNNSRQVVPDAAYKS